MRFSIAGAQFVATTPEGELELRSRLPGRFNVANALGAVARARPRRHARADRRRAARASLRRQVASRRSTRVSRSRCSIDYAHTPDSLENVLRRGAALSPTAALICVFGCGGDRDRGKRPQMGRISAELARTSSLVTSDNPRSEDPAAIIASDRGRAGDREPTARAVEAIVDRRRRSRARSRSRAPGDVVVIAGKGHEQGQEFAGGRIVPFDDARSRAPRCGPAARERLDAASGCSLGRARSRAPAIARPRAEASDGADPGPRRVVIDSRTARAPATSSSDSPAPTPTAAIRAATRWRGAPGACSGTGQRTSARRRRSAGGRAARAPRSAARAQQARARVARASWLRQVVGITGSTGKTSTKDILAALLRPAGARRRSRARENFNTEIGVAAGDPRGAAGHARRSCSRWRCAEPGQIAELTRDREPDVGVIVNVGPVHLEQLGSLEAVAAAKARAARRARAGRDRGGSRRRAAARRRTCARICAPSRFGPGGEVDARRRAGADGASTIALGRAARSRSSPSFAQATTCCTCSPRSPPRTRSGVGPPGARSRCASPRLRGERLALPGGVLADQRLLQRQPDVDARRARRPCRDGARTARRRARRHARARRARGAALHRELGERGASRRGRAAGHGRRARGAGRRELFARGERARSPARRRPRPLPAAALLPALLRAGDTVLVKGSRGALGARAGAERRAGPLAVGGRT